MTTTIRTQVAIVGAGPAGLLLSHLLDAAGIDCVVIDRRSRDEIEHTIRAGILEQGTVDLLSSSGASTRVLTEAHQHDGIELRFDGGGHRFDFPALTGRSVWLYPQHEVLKDLIAARLAAGQDLRFGVSAVEVRDAASLRPTIVAVPTPTPDAADAAPGGSGRVGPESGEVLEIEADVVVGADGSHGVVRTAVSPTGGHFREYPFAWFGILCEAPPSNDVLIYSNSDNGFALISQRSDTVQRMYFQCDPDADPEALSEREIWDELQSRVPGTTLNEGPIFQRDILRFRSFVAHEMRRGRVVLIGDAAHTVPPTGAKGMNLAVADVVLLERALRALLIDGDEGPLDRFPEVASRRIWKAQHFSWWMTSMLHTAAPAGAGAPGASDFDRRRQLGELRMVTQSEAGRRYLAEAYTGWPFETEL
jgi:p-hydroxybenzoate 3-monooxygenase